VGLPALPAAVAAVAAVAEPAGAATVTARPPAISTVRRRLI
jgi:hypothetical protein